MNGIATCGIKSLNLDIFLNSQVELKKLRFHTGGDSGLSKCVRMHVGKVNPNCPILTVHYKKMVNVTEINYLGDIFCADGRNLKNVQNRARKGTGSVFQIMKI